MKEYKEFLGFSNFYWHFIRGFSNLALLTTLLKGALKKPLTEQNYDLGDRELLAIKLALKEWRH